MNRAIALLLLAGASFTACAGQRPLWYDEAVRTLRASAHERFLIAAGQGDGRARQEACAAAESAARERATADLIQRYETHSEVVAVCGGPARVATCLRSFAATALVTAPRTQEHYDDAARRCWVELRWLEPRYLANAVRRVVEQDISVQEVAQALRGALGGPVDAAAPVATPLRPDVRGAPTPAALVDVGYRGWFVRFLAQPDCPTHLIAFVGAPGGAEARWLELKQTAAGWVVVDDERVAGEGWPAPPAVGLCD